MLCLCNYYMFSEYYIYKYFTCIFISDMIISRLQVKQLYKELLKYGSSLKLTDKNYYKNRIKQEFLDNSQLVKPDEIKFFYNVSENFMFY